MTDDEKLAEALKEVAAATDFPEASRYGPMAKVRCRSLVVLTNELFRLRSLLADYEKRLEIEHAWRLEKGELVRFEIPPAERPDWPDGITCRDETIKLLEEQLGRRKKPA